MSSTTTTEAVSLAAETAAAPAKSGSNYVAIGDQAEQIGGGLVYLSRNRKAVAKWSPGESRPPVYLTSDTGQVQQSVPYRAVGTALAHDVIPVSQVIDVYAKNGRLADLVDALATGEHSREVALALIDNHEDFVLGLTDEDEDEAPADGAEDQAEAEAEAEPQMS